MISFVAVERSSIEECDLDRMRRVGEVENRNSPDNKPAP